MSLFLMFMLCEGQEALYSKSHDGADSREAVFGSSDLKGKKDRISISVV